MPKKTLLLLVHGIRTRAEWQEKVATWLDMSGQVAAKPVRYGRFDLFRFLWPFGTRRAPIQKLKKEIEYQLALHPEGEWRRVIIAHSFGSYAITKILEEKPGLFLDDLILCGSIVSDEYDWINISKQIRGSIINDCSREDIWPVFAKSVTWGYGATGAYGFGSATVTNRFHFIGHSEYFNRDFVSKYWKPVIQDRRLFRGTSLKKTLGRPGTLVCFHCRSGGVWSRHFSYCWVLGAAKRRFQRLNGRCLRGRS